MLVSIAFPLCAHEAGLGQSGADKIVSVQKWEEELRPDIRVRMQKVMGPLPGPDKRCPLEVRIENETDCGEYVRRFLTYQSEPGSRVPAYLLIPKRLLQAGEKGIGVLCLHQTHPKGQKVVVGLGESPDDEYGVELAKRGFICVAPPYPLLADYNPELRKLGYVSGTMKAIWDNIRALDLLESFPFVEKGRFAAIGHSLGGHNALFTAVFEPRIKVVVTSCGFDSFRDYMDGNIRGWTSDRYMPRLLDYQDLPFDFDQVLSAIAPRRIFVSAPLGDTNFKWKSVDRVCHSARAIFELYHARDRLRVEHPNIGHRFPPSMRNEAYDFISEGVKLDQ